jgi:hypothetical protein
MKRPDARLPVDTLYVLGAGASHSLSHLNTVRSDAIKYITPLDKDFLSKINANILKKGWKRTSTKKLSSDWLDEGDVFAEGLEKAIIKRVSQFDFLSNLNPERARRKCSNEDYLNHIVHLVTAYLLRCKSNKTGATKKFINHVFPIGNKEEFKNRIVTFNYDTLIEKPLLERGISMRKIYFDRIVSNIEEGFSRTNAQKHINPLIIKLHGSVNWRCERKNFNELIFGNPGKSKYPIWVCDQIPNPTDNNSPLIIPPIPNKPITRSILFKFLWTTAFEYLHEAKNLVIVGYSCPQTDTLARTMFTHFKNKKIETISIVDPNVISLKNYKEMINPKQISQNVLWKYYGSFNEYIKLETNSLKN